MDLFSNQDQSNILPYDGELVLIENVFNRNEALKFMDLLMSEMPWRNDELVLFGKKIVTQRKVAWYGDKPFYYMYSNTVKKANHWTPELLEVKRKVEECAGETFNSCLLNLYHNGDEGMAWHSDDEKELKKHGTIASLSLGATRRFLFRHNVSKETIELTLQPGSILLMKGDIQDHWKHSLPKSKKVKTPRVNLTFRSINELLQST